MRFHDLVILTKQTRIHQPPSTNTLVQRPDLPALRRSALLTLVLTAAMLAISTAALFTTPTPPGGMLPLPLAVYSVASTYIFFGAGLSWGAALFRWRGPVAAPAEV